MNLDQIANNWNRIKNAVLSRYSFIVFLAIGAVIAAAPIASKADVETGGPKGDPRIIVKDPNGGEIWHPGQRERIRWRTPGVFTYPNVQIELRRNNQFVRNIKNVTENDGRTSWLVPDDLLFGGGYRVVIVSILNAAIRDRSNDTFSIAGVHAPVDLGSAGNYVILAKSGIDTVPTSAVTGDLGVSPIDSTAITGFSLSLDGSERFSKSSQVTGKVFAADYTSPTPSKLTTAVGDMETAYTDAAGRAPDVTELGAGSIGGLTLIPGVYKWGTSVNIPTDVTLSGAANDVWIFQIAGNLTVAGAKAVILSGGAQPKNIFWQVGGGAGVTLGMAAHLEGVVLAQTAINLGSTASVNGRLLAQTAVNIIASVVTEPAP